MPPTLDYSLMTSYFRIRYVLFYSSTIRSRSISQLPPCADRFGQLSSGRPQVNIVSLPLPSDSIPQIAHFRLAVVYYDWSINISDEFRWIWSLKKRPNLASLVYVLIRYPDIARWTLWGITSFVPIHPTVRIFHGVVKPIY